MQPAVTAMRFDTTSSSSAPLVAGEEHDLAERHGDGRDQQETELLRSAGACERRGEDRIAVEGYTASQGRALARATSPSQRALGLGGARRSPVDGDEPEGGPVAEGPLEVVEGRPVRCSRARRCRRRGSRARPAGPARRTSMRRASSSVAMPFSVTSSGRAAGQLPRPADGGRQRLGPELVAHDAWSRTPVLGPTAPVGPDAGAGVGLHAEEVVARGRRRGRRPRRSRQDAVAARPRRPSTAW